MIAVLLALACSTPAPVGEPVVAPSSAPVAPTAMARKDVTIEDLDAARATGARIVDVRTAEEFAAGHVPGAQNFPIDELDPMSSDAWAKDAPIYLICEKGGRSKVAADKLAAAGYDARNVLGGTAEWRAKGLPVE